MTMLAVQLVLARLLSPRLFGLLAIVLVFANLADAIAQSGIGTGLIQLSHVDAKTVSTAFWLSIAFSLVIAFLIFFASPPVARFYGDSDLVWPLRIVGITVIANAIVSVFRSLLQRDLDFYNIFRATFAATALAGCISIFMAAKGFGIWALVGLVAFNSLLSCVFLSLVVRREIRLQFDRGVALELLNFGWKIGATGVLNVLHNSVSELIVGKTISVSQLGYFNQGRKWPITGITVVTNSLQNFLYPSFAKLKDKPKELKQSIEKSLSLGNFVVMPLPCLIGVTADNLVLILLGERWIPATFVFTVTAFSFLGLMVQSVNLRAYLALGRSDVYLGLQIIKVFLNIAISAAVALVTKDINLVAVATGGVTLFSMFVIDVFPASRVTGISIRAQYKIFSPSLLICIAASLITVVVGKYVVLNAFTGLLLDVAVFFGSYFLLARVVNLSAFRQLQTLIRNRF